MPLEELLIKSLSNFASISGFPLYRSAARSPESVLLCLDAGEYV